MRYFIEFSYKGTAYNGWQKQPNSYGVQEALEKALAIILRVTVEVTGSSRTDTGVHAEQQFAHFDLEEPLKDVEKTVYALNKVLPADIAVAALHPVANDLHSRFVATHRRYEYRISKVKNPFLTGQVYFLRTELNVPLMNEAAGMLLTHRDFQSFSKIHTNVNNFLCTITTAHWEERGDQLVFVVQANRFLRGMVRALVGTLLAVGSGKLSVADFEAIILARDRAKAGVQAPAEGLFLTEVGYPLGLLS